MGGENSKQKDDIIPQKLKYLGVGAAAGAAVAGAASYLASKDSSTANRPSKARDEEFTVLDHDMEFYNSYYDGLGSPGARSPLSPGSRSLHSTGARSPQSPGARSPQYPGAMSPQSPGAMSPQYPGARSPQSPGAMSPQSLMGPGPQPGPRSPQSTGTAITRSPPPQYPDFPPPYSPPAAIIPPYGMPFPPPPQFPVGYAAPPIAYPGIQPLMGAPPIQSAELPQKGPANQKQQAKQGKQQEKQGKQQEKHDKQQEQEGKQQGKQGKKGQEGKQGQQEQKSQGKQQGKQKQDKQHQAKQEQTDSGQPVEINLMDLNPLERMEKEKILTKDLRHLLLLNGGQLQLSKVQSVLDKMKIRLGSHSQFIQRHADKFRTEQSDEASVHKSWVFPYTDLKLCSAHVSKSGCGSSTCDKLHVCKFFLLSGTCRFEQRGRPCKYGHCIDRGHNLELLKDHALEDLPLQCINLLFQKNRSGQLYPRTCKFFNSNSSCKKGQSCLGLHVCKHFLLGHCKFGDNCRYLHNLYNDMCLPILHLYGFDTQLSQQEVMVELRRGMRKIGDEGGDSDDDDDASSTISGAASSAFSGSQRGGRGRGAERGGRGAERGGRGAERGGRGAERGGRGAERGGRGAERGGRGAERGGRGAERGRGGGRGTDQDDEEQSHNQRGGGRGRGRGRGRGGVQGDRPDTSEFAPEKEKPGHASVMDMDLSSVDDLQNLFTMTFKQLLDAMQSKQSELGGNDDSDDSDDTASTTSASDVAEEGQGAKRKTRRTRRSKNKPKQNIETETDKPPIICSYFLNGSCKHNVKCSRSHRDLPYQWQFLHTLHQKWVDFPNYNNLQIEQAYCDPNQNACDSQMVTPDASKRMKFSVQFDPMLIYFQGSKDNIQTHVRRLTTSSAVMSPPNRPFVTNWTWFWKNDQGHFTKYHDQKSGGLSTDVGSRELEESYNENPRGVLACASSSHEYVVDLSRMVQINLATQRERKIRRRPATFLNPSMVQQMKGQRSMQSKLKKGEPTNEREEKREDRGSEVLASDVPAFWDLNAPSDNDNYQLVNIKKQGSTFHEYEKIETQFYETLRRDDYQITQIQRIQNLDLYEGFQLLQKRMMKRAGSSKQVEEKFLFHGTNKRYIDAICQQGFDWRLSGSSTGTLYGKGSYFAKAASYSRSYTDSGQLFVARVLVGRYTKGESHYVRPPPRDPAKPQGPAFDSCVDDVNNPNIYVVFHHEQAYPEYLIDFKKTR